MAFVVTPHEPRMQRVKKTVYIIQCVIFYDILVASVRLGVFCISVYTMKMSHVGVSRPFPV